MDCRCVLNVGAGLAEGPCWWAEKQVLLWVDIEASRIGLFDPQTARNNFLHLPAHVGAVVPTSAGDLLLATAAGFLRLDPSTEAVTLLSDPEADRPGNRFNDGKCSPDGRFFAGTISLVKNTGDAALYRLDSDLSLHTAFSGVTNSNGIVWSAEAGICYYIDTPRRAVLAFDYSAKTGELSNLRTAFSTDHISASPDGMSIDSAGHLWVAFCHGACVICYDPSTGRQLHRVELPCLETTACAFGGENLDELYVTTGVHTTHEEEDAGRLLRIRGLGVTGVPAHVFVG